MSQFTVEALLKVNGGEKFASTFKSAENSIKSFQAAGKNIGSVGKQIGTVGSKLTNSITKPAGVAALAVSGLVTTLGFKRLIGLDTAKAKLVGLGYATEDVGRITTQVTNAVKGGMTTLGEGVDIAAGALAAGVDEGEELERYIRLVGDAAVGSGRDVGEMAQIFNRVQGMGKLMTQELNQIEQGLPGFSQAMADELAGGSLETFRKMVTNGEVGSEEFLNVMDEFAGGMAEAYSESWAGMVKNTLAYVGMIGEALVGGLFEDGKKGLAELIELLQSQEIMDWAEKTGESIRVAAQKIVSSVQSIVQWWTSLNEGTQKVIIQFGLFMIALGPVLSIVSKVMIGIRTLTTVISFVVGVVGKLVFAFSSVAGGAATLGEALLFLVNPIVLVIAAVVAVVAAFVYFYNTNEMVREAVNAVWNFISTLITTIVGAVVSFVMTVWGSLVSFWQENNQLILQTVKTVFGGILNVITTVLNFLKPFISASWGAIKSITSTVWNAIKGVVELAINLVLAIIKTAMQLINGDWRGAWETVKSAVSTAWESIKTIVSEAIEGVRTTITNYASKLLAAGKQVMQAVADGIRQKISDVLSATNEIGNTIKSAVADIDLLAAGKAIIDGFVSGLKSAWDTGKTFIGGIGGWIKENKGPISYDKKLLVGAGNAIMFGLNKGLEDDFSNVKNTVRGMASSIQDTFKSSPTMDINGSIARSNAQVNSRVSHEINNAGKQPAYVNFSLGGKSYRGFVDDISNAQNSQIQLTESYL